MKTSQQEVDEELAVARGVVAQLLNVLRNQQHLHTKPEPLQTSNQDQDNKLLAMVWSVAALSLFFFQYKETLRA